MFGLSTASTIMKNALNNQYIVNGRGIRFWLHLPFDELIEKAFICTRGGCVRQEALVR